MKLTTEQNELDRKVESALSFLKTHIEFSKKENKNGNADGVVKFLESAYDIFAELREEWRKNLGEPVKLNSKAISDVLLSLNDFVKKYNFSINKEGVERLGKERYEENIYSFCLRREKKGA